MSRFISELQFDRASARPADLWALVKVLLGWRHAAFIAQHSRRQILLLRLARTDRGLIARIRTAVLLPLGGAILRECDAPD